MIDADIVIFRYDPADMVNIYRWMKEGDVVHELIISDRVMTESYPFCPACFVLRGEPIQMVRDRERQVFICPTCKGRMGYGEQVFCTCKEIPHRLSCPMGFDNYFPWEPAHHD